MMDPKSNIAEQLAYAPSHHQKIQQETKAAEKKVEMLQRMLARFEALSRDKTDES